MMDFFSDSYSTTAFEEAYKSNFQDIAIIMDKEANITLESVTTRLTHVMSCLDYDKGLCIYRIMD